MPEKFQLIEAVADDLDYDEIKEEIHRLYKERAALFSFYESPTGELYLKLSSPNLVKDADDALFKLKLLIESMEKKVT